jgi:hypothetical protein
MLVMILVFMLVALAIGGGSWGWSRYGWVGMSPAGVILLILAILFLTGHLPIR